LILTIIILLTKNQLSINLIFEMYWSGVLSTIIVGLIEFFFSTIFIIVLSYFILKIKKKKVKKKKIKKKKKLK
jgi:hypothetical protein